MAKRKRLDDEEDFDLDDPIRLPPANDGYEDHEYKRNKSNGKKPPRRQNRRVRHLGAG